MIGIFNRWIDRYFADEEAVIVALMLVAGLATIIFLGVVLAPMISAIIIAFLMQGVVAKFTAWGMRHIVAVSLSFLILAGSIGVGLLYVMPALWHQVANLISETPGMLQEGQELLLLLPDEYPNLITESQVRELIEGLHKELGQVGQVVLSFSMAQLPVILSILIYLVLVPILVFFFLKDGKEMLTTALNTSFPERICKFSNIQECKCALCSLP